MADEPTVEEILKVAAQADGLMVTYGQITADEIAGLEKCKVIGQLLERHPGAKYNVTDPDSIIQPAP